MDKYELINKIKKLEGLTNEEKSALLGLLRSHKKYGLVWEDKPEAVEEEMKNKLPVLTEVKERAIINDTETEHYPNHILIEGDNLHALTVLSYTHSNSIDVIYIDPPYNTGNKDFIYNDQFVDKEDSYRHSKWLSFMEKRLKIARGLLSPKGVIFVSIDDHEQANLKLLCDEIFWETNFVGQLIIKTATDNNPSQINTEHEYMLCYALRKEKLSNWQRISLPAELIMNKYKELKKGNTDTLEIQKALRVWIKQNKEQLPQVAHYNKVDENGVYSSSSNSSNPHPGGYIYSILHPVTGKPCPNPANGWRWPKSTFDEYEKNGEIEWGKDESTQPHVKKRIETSTEYLRTLIYEDNRGTTKALSDIFSGKKVFNNPKPINVLKRIIDFASSPNSIILDFFAGSGTTLHATMELNKEDGGHRQCILVTNNENGICENVTYERNKRVIEGYTTPKGENIEGLHGNNLRYYKTDFVQRERTVKNMRDLVDAATDMLCIKENMYVEQSLFGPWDKLPSTVARHFTDGESREMLIIYDETHIGEIAKAIAGMKFGTPLKVYVFSTDRDPYIDEFNDVLDKVELCALPAAIYDAYVQVMPHPQDRQVEMASDSNDEGMNSWENDEETTYDLAAEEDNR